MAVLKNQGIEPTLPVSENGVATTAVTDFHNPTAANVAVVVAAADNPNGMRLSSVYGIARAALGGATNYALYEIDGTTFTLLDSVLASDVTPSASVANGKAAFSYADDAPLYLKAGKGLGFAIGRTVANGVVGWAMGGAYEA